jgi:hypothetical protein
MLITCALSVSHAQITNSQTVTGRMAQARVGAAAVLLPDGRILITGGASTNGTPLASAEFYNPSTGGFSFAPSMSEPRSNHAAIVLKNGNVLVTGGLTSGGGYSDSAELFDAKSGKWALLDASLGTGRAGHSMAILPDGNVVIAGGKGTAGTVGSLMVFNFSDRTISHAGSLLTARTDAVAAATPDGRVIIAGGIDRDNKVLASTEIFKYDPATHMGGIIAGPSMSSPRTSASATSTYDGVAIVGGHNGHIDLGTADIFDASTNRFTVANGGTPRSGHFAALLPNNGHILILGGTGGASADLLQPWGNSRNGAFLATSGSLSNRNGGFASPSLSGSLLAGGGNGRSAELFGFPTVVGKGGVITGTGFKAGEQVALHFHPWSKQSVSDAPDAIVKADSKGNFGYSGTVPSGTNIHVTAIGRTSGNTGQGVIIPNNTSKIASVTLSAQSGTLTYGTAGSVTFTVTVNPTGVGVFTTTALTVTGLPAGVTGSFNPTTVTGGPGTTGVTSILTLTSTSAAAGGTINFTVTATNHSDSNDTKSGNGTFTLGTRPVTLTAGSLIATTYDGNTHALGGCVSSASTFVTCTNNPAGPVGPDATSGAQTVTPTPNYLVGVAADYTITSNNGAYEIDKANADCSSIMGYTVTYDAASHTASGTCNGVGGSALSVVHRTSVKHSVPATGLDLTGTAHTEANTYNDSWTFTDLTGDYNSTGGNVTDTINQAASSVTVSCTTGAPFTYSGLAQTPCTATVNGPGTPSQTVTWTYTNNVNAYNSLINNTGSGAMANFAGDTDHTASNGSGSFVINTASATILTAPQAYSVSYDGIAHFATGGSATGVLGESLNADFRVNNTTHTRAGTFSTDSWSFHDPNCNYADVPATVIVDVIGKANANITAPTPYSVTYTGLAQTATGGMALGVDSNPIASGNFNLGGTTHTHAGTYSDTWRFHDTNGNYNDATGQISDSIAKANATIIVTPYGVTYDGLAHTAAGSATGVLAETLSGLHLGLTTHTNAGTFSDSWSFADVTGNYNNVSATPITDSITKANATIVSGPTGYCVSYDSGSHSAAPGSAMDANGNPMSGTDFRLGLTTHTNVGTFNDTWGFHDPSGNYNDLTGQGPIEDKISPVGTGCTP